ncbi:MAG: SDR family oxidoreductase [Proteobacteria bacterium]|nr:SDR family oxidoreductase [Pseudomonadota bacterium]
MSTRLIISISSDIGTAAGRRWLARGWSVAGTYRTPSSATAELAETGATLVPCDLTDIPSVKKACTDLVRAAPVWDVLMICPATMEPIAPFLECDFDEWERSVSVNLTQQMRFAHALLPMRRRGTEQLSIVILFAGPGTNNAPRNYSAEIVSKIGQIKMCELLDAEVSDARFVIVGPGWADTKIHAETLRAGEKAGSNYQRTLQKLNSDECTPMSQILDFLDWAIAQPRDVVSGRNFSVVNDIWGERRLGEKLSSTPDMFKLRRYLNDWRGDDIA